MIGTYLVKLSSGQLSDADSAEATRLLKIIGDLERIGDHAENLVESANEMQEKGISLTEVAGKELTTLTAAMTEILGYTRRAFVDGDMAAVAEVEPLEEIVDRLKDRYRTSHIKRLQQGKCTIEAGFVWNDILTDLERTADHCSNIAASVTDGEHIHEAQRGRAASFDAKYAAYAEKYLN